MTERDRVWISADYSQAEARVVAWFGPVPLLKQWFLTGEDVHTNVAKMISRVVQLQHIRMPGNLFAKYPWESVPKDSEERQVAKTTVHGNNYDMGAQKFALVTGLPLEHATVLQNIYHSQFPEIRENYQKGIRERIQRTRTLQTPQGRRIVFYDLLSEELYREAYAWLPQSTVGDLTTKWFIRCCQHFNKAQDLGLGRWLPGNIRACGFNVKIQVHDSLMVSVPNDRDVIMYTARKMKEYGEMPLLINGEILTIPVDFKIGPSWGELEDLKI
jgi:DNA polymerase I-like protein with 3'-5' exonuclease and polymerase domains